MGNSAFGYVNAVTVGQVFAGSEEGAMPVSRLQNLFGSPSAGWQTQNGVVLSTDGAWWGVDALTDWNYRAFLLARTNLTPSALVRWRVGTQEAIFPPNPVFDIDYTRNTDWVAQGPGTLAVARSSVGWRCRPDGEWEEIAANLPRIHHDPVTGETRGILSEPTSTNSIRNPLWEGMVPSTTPPTNMAVATAGGISVDWLGFETLDGLPGVHLRVYGTATSGAYARIYLEASNQVANTTGVLRSMALFAFLTIAFSGSDAGITGTVLGFEGQASGGVVLGSSRSAVTDIRDFRPGASRRIHRGSVAGGGTQTHARPFVEIPVTNGTTVDVGIWLAAPNFEATSTPTTPMFPVVGSPAAFTRATETVNYTLGAGVIDETQGTIVAEWVAGTQPEYYHPGAQNGGSALQLDNGGNTERYLMRSSANFAGSPVSAGTIATDFLVTVGNVAVYDAAGSPLQASPPRALDSYSPTDPFRAALTWGGGGNVLHSHVGIGTDSGYSGTLPTGLTRLQTTTTQYGTICLVRVRYYSERLTMAQLNELTLSGDPLDYSGISYDSGWLSGTVVAGVGQSCHVAPSNYTARYARCDIDDSTNTDGFIAAALSYTGPLWEPMHGADWSSAFSIKKSEQSLEARGGQEYVEFQYRQRVWEVALTALKDDEIWPYQQVLDKVAGKGENVLFIPDRTSPYLGSEAVYGLLKSTSPVGYSTKASKYRSWRARISERL